MLEPLDDDDPREIGPFTTEGRLGAGAMGRVYLGHTADGRRAAIKLVRAELADDRDFRARFRQEVAAVRLVHGRHTAALVDADADAARPWLATEYLDGPTLRDTLATRGPLPIAEVLTVAEGVADALVAIHAAGLVHRDLKPGNVILAPDGPRVIDFGIARAADATSLTATGVAVGTPTYMAPEHIRDNTAGPPADVFALGVLIAVLATGQRPFGEGETSAVLYRIMHGEPQLGELADPLRAVVVACLAKDPAHRPTAEAIAAHCRALLTPVPQPVAPPVPHPAPPRRSRVPAVGLVALVVLVVAAAITVPLVYDNTVSGTPVAAEAAPDEVDEAGTSTPPCAEGTVEAAGSSQSAEAIELAAAEWSAACPSAELNYTPSGTGAGVAEFLASEVDLAVVDRSLTEDDLSQFADRCTGSTERTDAVLTLPLVFTPVALAYNLPGVDDLRLDATTLAEILTGEITKWNDSRIVDLNSGATLPAVPISVVTRSGATQQTATLQEYLTAAGTWSTGAGPEFTGGYGQAVQREEDVLAAVGATNGAIGYVSGRGAVDHNLPAARLNDMTPDALIDTVAEAMTADPAELPDAIYRTTDGYPLIGVAYAVACAEYPDTDTAAAVQGFLTTALTTPADVTTSARLPTGRLASRLRTVVDGFF